MNKAQWITVSASFLLVIALFAATQPRLFGERKAKTSHDNHDHAEATAGHFTVDTVLHYSKLNLTSQQAERVNQLENSISRGDVAAQKLHVFHQLAAFWRDSARIFAPYALYTAEAARLENSEKSLTFAARLFLDNLTYEENPQLKQWEASEAKDLFERSLKLNPGNDSAKVGMGAAILFGGSAAPMEGIQLIRSVAEKDSTNTYAQMTLAKASLMSGQLDKAVERLQIVNRHDRKNVEAVLLMAEVYERMGRKSEAVQWYRKSMDLLPNQQFRQEVEKRISELNK